MGASASPTWSPRTDSLPPDRAERGAWVGCIAGALSKGEYEAGLAAAGFTDIHVAFTHQVGDGLHSAVIKATKPVGAASASTATDPVARTTLPLPPTRPAAEMRPLAWPAVPV